MELFTPCVETTYGRNSRGYGQCGNPWKRNGSMLHHRLVYMLANNLTPQDIKGLLVRHKCDNPGCVNPKHLELGTYQDNYDDMLQRGRTNYTGRLAGTKNNNAKLTEELVIAIRQEFKVSPDAKKLAAKYGVGKTNIYLIINKLTWKTV